MSEQITQWSLSRYKDYKKCPALAHYKHVLKLREPGNAAMSRGLAVHKLAEAAVAPRAKLPPELAHHKAHFKEASKYDCAVEGKWAFTKLWRPVEFFAANVWVRIITDLTIRLKPDTLRVVDHKTGRKYDDHLEDISLYALGAFATYPEVKQVQTEFWYLDQPKDNVTVRAFSIEDVPALKKEWAKKTKPLLVDTTFAPRPNQGCPWCHFRKANGGPCEF